MKKIKKIIIGLILGLILAFTLALEPQKVKANTTITNLYGYTWTANSVINIQLEDSYLLSFKTLPDSSGNVEEFTGIVISQEMGAIAYANPNNVLVYQNNNWLNDKYKTIYFTENYSNNELINWLQLNGTLTKNITPPEPPEPIYYTITFNRNGATSGELPPLQDVVSGTTFDLNNYNPGNLSKTDSTFLGWNTDASATTPLTSIVVNSDVLLYAIFSDNPKKVNIKITCRGNVVWQGNAIFNNNKIVGGVDWSNPSMTLCYFNNVDSQNMILINDIYGNNPSFANNQLMLFFKTFSTETDDNGRYLAYIELIRVTTPKGTYAQTFESSHNPKNIDFENWLASEGLTNMLNVDSDNYYFNIEVSWSLEEPLPTGVAEWGNVATIMARIMASVTTLLNINIGFITLGNLLLIVISLSVLFFVIKVWKGGN